MKAAQELRFFHRSRRKPTLPNSAIESSRVTANKPVALFPIKDARALPVFVFTIRVAVPLSFFSETDPTAHVGAGEAVAVTLQLKYLNWDNVDNRRLLLQGPASIAQALELDVLRAKASSHYPRRVAQIHQVEESTEGLLRQLR